MDAVDLKVVGQATKSLTFPLNDGSTFTVTVTVVTAKRAKNEYTDVGEPIYNIYLQITQGVSDIPDEFLGPPGEVKVPRKPKRSPEVM